ncbi:extensin family protein [Pukyongiella litopenaei]|uniref:Extensin family protein n=1 Tax=Pukyongiella litopenaei TaxID=2605946 RepID=A0A2S0MLY2_9RHOB|nr:extensin family protein [Pukyongiella litopenaei]AVO36889.1 extensin family protein [Pukyongiella litopenaei]
MIGRGAAITAVLVLWAGLTAAAAPDRSPRPAGRPAEPQVARAVVAAIAPVRPHARPGMTGPVMVPVPVQPARLRPHARPVSEQVTLAAARSATPLLGPADSLRPHIRPGDLEHRVMARRRARAKGAVCGDPDIQGEAVGRVPGRIRGCGIPDAVKVTSVSGVRLSQPSLMNCTTAQAFKNWMDHGIKPAFRRRGPVVELKVAAHYACRTRNSRKGARISEHGKGNAIDISAFTMMDGEVITVLRGWGQGTTLKPLRNVWKSACGPFGTVLGPGSDGYHRDHIHVDTARYRNGTYCR